ncbi:MAG: hypothetical protein ACYCVD_04280 [Desulfitobacteriaceae bacterium]
MEMRKADLILVRGRGWFSKEIEEITKSPYSHVAGIVKENELVEANGFRFPGVTYAALDYYAGRADVFTCDVLAKEQRQQITNLAISEVGDPYDYPLLFWQFFRYRFGWHLPYREGKSRECSVLWAEIYRNVGIDLCQGIEYPSPADLAQSKLLRKVGGI